MSNLQNITPEFPLRVISEEGEIWHRPVLAIQTGNAEGPLSILSGHANFISIITDDVQIYMSGEKTHSFSVETGIIRMRDNELELFLGVEVLDIEK